MKDPLVQLAKMMAEKMADEIFDPALQRAFENMRKDYPDDEDFAEYVLMGVSRNIELILGNNRALRAFVTDNPSIPDNGALPVHFEVSKNPVTKLSFHVVGTDTSYDVMLRKDWKGMKLRRSVYTVDIPDAVTIEGRKAIIYTMRVLDYERSLLTSHETMKDFVDGIENLLGEAMIDALKRNTNAIMH